MIAQLVSNMYDKIMVNKCRFKRNRVPNKLFIMTNNYDCLIRNSIQHSLIEVLQIRTNFQMIYLKRNLRKITSNKITILEHILIRLHIRPKTIPAAAVRTFTV